MKRVNFLFVLFVMALVTGCTNLDFFERRLDDYEARLQKLENEMQAANRDIVALRELFKANEKAITITDYRPLDDNSGYVLTMSDGNKIVLKNGLNGQSSAIGVKKGEDGILYWTLNGEYMYDGDGNKIQAKGENGVNGATPQLRVNKDGYWEYSFDGKSWHAVLDENFAPVKANGGGVNDLEITESNGFLIIKFKGQTFVIPLTNGGSGGVVNPQKPAAELTMEVTEFTLLVGESETLQLEVAPKDIYTLEDVVWTSSDPKVVKVENGKVTGIGKGEATVTAAIDKVSVQCKITVAEKLKIKIDVLEVSTVYAKIKFTPSDQVRSYMASVHEKDDWLKSGAKEKGTFEVYDLPMWKNFGGENWWSILETFLDVGIQEYQPFELGCPLQPNTTYVVSAYGIDFNGYLTGEETIAEFTTKDRVTYNDFTFSLTDIDCQPRSISATIIPSDNEKTYIATIESARFFESWNNPDLYEKMCYNIAGSNPAEKIRQGRDILEKKNRFPNSDYYIIVFGYDLKQGVTTKPTFKKVTTSAAND